MRFFALIAAVAAVKLRTKEGPSQEDIHGAAQWLGHAIVSVADKDGNGALNAKEGKAFMDHLGEQIGQYDANGDHEIDGGELSKAIEDGLHALRDHVNAQSAA